MTRLSEIEKFELLKARTHYDGDNLRWTNCHVPSFNGTVCGRPDKDGYPRINLGRCNGMVSVHRLVFYIIHGYIPELVDHIDGNILNNRADNLRAATRLQNSINSKTPKTNTSGRKGVYSQKGTGKWIARIRANNRVFHLGTFITFEEAAQARAAAEEKYHGEYRRV
jgi:hypothetical protein